MNPSAARERGSERPATEAAPGWRERYLRERAQLLEAMERARPTVRGIRTDLRRLATLTDRALRHLWHELELGRGCTLLAVGGYGRRELFPHSDIDVLILIQDHGAGGLRPALQQRIESFVSQCWDAGLEIGSSVRTVGQCAELARSDITVQTAVLEQRRLAGSIRLQEQLRERLSSDLDLPAFFLQKQLEMRQRHRRHHGTPYELEPNCKESPGGLRDLHLISWIAQAAGIGKRWADLHRHGLATQLEVQQLRYHEAMLSRIRARLHLITGRREDRLLFSLQISLAQSFGLNDRVAPNGRIRLRASEVLMRRYYWSAKGVTQLTQMLLQVLQETIDRRRGAPPPPPTFINTEFAERDGLLELRQPLLYQRRPEAILETFLFVARTDGITGLATSTLRALYNALPLMGKTFRHNEHNHQTFLAILQQTGSVAPTLRLMNETSVLGRYLWVFQRIVGQMQHDLYHVYTVDQHILMVLRNMENFFRPEHAHEFPLCSRLAAGWDQPWLLFIAALFHDIAKGRGGRHSELGARDVRRFCRRLGLRGEPRRLVEFLVREHLTLSTFAQKRDLSDPDVIADFAARVGSQRRLTALYMLTVADIRGTSPRVWTAWKGKLLHDLYRYTARALGGWQPSADALVEARKREALQQLMQDRPQVDHEALWDALDVGYFMHHDSDAIAWHTRHLARHLAIPGVQERGDRQPHTTVRARRALYGDSLQVMVFTHDRADLFARICEYFDRSAFSIVDARIHTMHNGWALDTFQIAGPFDPDYSTAQIERIEAELPAALDVSGPLRPPRLGRASARARSFPLLPRVEFAADEHGRNWLLSVHASDRPGVLYAIAHALAQQGINVRLAKITTLGERIEDIFLVDHALEQQPSARTRLERELTRTLALSA